MLILNLPASPSSSSFTFKSFERVFSINSLDFFLNLVLSFLDSSSPKPRYFLSMARSQSSENRSISPQPLLRLVPPLKTKLPLYSKLNIALRTMLTQKSFSTAFSFIPFSSAILLNIVSFSSSGRFIHIVFSVVPI